MSKKYDRIWGRNIFVSIFCDLSVMGVCLFLDWNCMVLLCLGKQFLNKIGCILCMFILEMVLYKLIIKQRKYMILDEKLTYGYKKEIYYFNIKALFFSLAEAPRGVYNLKLNKSYVYNRKSREKRYISNVQICTSNIKRINDEYEIIPTYSFFCYEPKTIIKMINNSHAHIYVSSSLLSSNNWNLSEFMDEYSIKTNKVIVLNDQRKIISIFDPTTI